MRIVIRLVFIALVFPSCIPEISEQKIELNDSTLIYMRWKKTSLLDSIVTVNGIRQGPAIVYDDSSKLSEKCTFINGYKEGYSKKYENNVLRSVSFLQNGKPGPIIQFYKNGAPKNYQVFINDSLHFEHHWSESGDSQKKIGGLIHIGPITSVEDNHYFKSFFFPDYGKKVWIELTVIDSTRIVYRFDTTVQGFWSKNHIINSINLNQVLIEAKTHSFKSKGFHNNLDTTEIQLYPSAAIN